MTLKNFFNPQRDIYRCCQCGGHWDKRQLLGGFCPECRHFQTIAAINRAFLSGKVS